MTPKQMSRLLQVLHKFNCGLAELFPCQVFFYKQLCRNTRKSLTLKKLAEETSSEKAREHVGAPWWTHAGRTVLSVCTEKTLRTVCTVNTNFIDRAVGEAVLLRRLLLVWHAPDDVGITWGGKQRQKVNWFDKRKSAIDGTSRHNEGKYFHQSINERARKNWKLNKTVAEWLLSSEPLVLNWTTLMCRPNRRKYSQNKKSGRV